MSRNRNLFKQTEFSKLPRNVFDLSHDYKFSCNMGELVPVLTLDCVPGDKINLSPHALIRLAPMVSPVMHRVDVFFHCFAVPYRLVWPNFETFMTGETENVPPTLAINEFTTANYRLTDYMGLLSMSSTNSAAVSAIPFAAYQMIWNEYYRDQNLQTPVDFELIDGDNSATTDLYMMQYRAWEHDYFTSCLPFAQKGNPADIPLGLISLDPDWASGPTPSIPIFRGATANLPGTGELQNVAGGGSPIGIEVIGGDISNAYDPDGSLVISPTTITDLRTAMKIQEFLEKDARGGTRYTEWVLAHFGVKSSDARLQRPEYITGSKSPVVISEVLNTTGTDDLPQGNMSGHGVSVTDGRYGTYYCQEHCYIICIMSVLPKTAYQQGIPRHFSRVDRFDFYQSEFAHIGEQEVYNKEIYADQNSTNQNAVFGYNPRYSEYKYMPNRVAGQFKTTLNTWHMGRIFDTPPALNELFIRSNPTKRIFAVTDPADDCLFCHVYHEIRAVRPMSFFGSPSI